MVARKGDPRGFTLIEILVVVTLVLALTAIIAPTFRVTSVRRVENVAHQIVAHLELARSQSLSNRRLVRVQFDTTGGSYTAFMDHDGDGAIAASPDEQGAFAEFGVRELDGLVEFGRGSAAPAPGDVNTSGMVTLADGRLLLDSQGVPAPWGTMGTIYLVHAQDQDAVAAVTIASSGAFKAWRWWPDPGEWR